MNSTSLFKALLLAGSMALGLVVHLRAEPKMAGEQPAPITGNLSLLGQTYGTLTYSYINLDGSSTHADNYNFSVNQPLAFGLDGILGYDYSQSGVVAGGRVRQHALSAAVRAFSGAHNWGKPYLELGAGYAWNHSPNARDNSFIWEVAVGAEIQINPRATATPYIQYADRPDLAGGAKWNFGVKGSYWVDSQWALTAGLEFDNDQNTAFTVGTNFRF